MNRAKPTPGEKLDELLSKYIRMARFEGWERGKEQVKTPHDYTLGNEEHPKGLFKELKQALADFIEGEVREIIGNDEMRPTEGPQRNGIVQGLRRARNKTRTEQRQRLESWLRELRS